MNRRTFLASLVAAPFVAVGAKAVEERVEVLETWKLDGRGKVASHTITLGPGETFTTPWIKWNRDPPFHVFVRPGGPVRICIPRS